MARYRCDYVVTIGANSSAVAGSDAELFTLTASVNAFTRLFFGVVSASGLRVTDPFVADESLLQQLDLAFRLPTPRVSWEF